MTLAINEIHEGDCLELMKLIPDKSVDMILCDLPYGTTACKWDTVIPFEPLWAEYERVIKDNGAILLTGSQPFTTDLINSKRKLFKQSLVWNKIQSTDFVLANKRHLKQHEDIVIFYKKQPTYNPQMVLKEKPLDDRNWKNNKKSSEHNNFSSKEVRRGIKTHSFPKSIITFNSTAKECNGPKRVHPTQKPVSLFEYLIKTYTSENEIILDNCIGSGTTAVAAINTNRQFIGIEMDADYVEIARNRIDETRGALL